MDIPVFVTQSARIALRCRIESGLEFEIVQIRFERALVIVVVNFAATHLHMTDPEIEYVRLPARAFGLWQIRVAILCHENTSDGMVEDNVFEVPLPLHE